MPLEYSDFLAHDKELNRTAGSKLALNLDVDNLTS